MSPQMAVASSSSIVSPVSQGAGTLNATGVDILDYEGVVEFVQNLGAITGSIGTNKLQHSDTQGGTYTDVDQGGQTLGTTANAISSVKINVSEIKRWVRYTAVITTGPVLLSVTLAGFKKYR